MPAIATQLRLAYTAPTEAAHPRPFRTYYYGSGATFAQWSAIGRAASLRGAARAALIRLIDERAVKADIYNEDGVRIAWLSRTRDRISVYGV